MPVTRGGGAIRVPPVPLAPAPPAAAAAAAARPAAIWFRAAARAAAAGDWRFNPAVELGEGSVPGLFPEALATAAAAAAITAAPFCIGKQGNRLEIRNQVS